MPPADALQAGDITISGDSASAHDFFTYFDPPSKDPIKLIVAVHQPAPDSTQAT